MKTFDSTKSDKRILFWLVVGLILCVGVMAAAWTADEVIKFSNYRDDTAFTPAGANSLFSMIGAEVDDSSSDSVDENDGGAVRMSSNRALHVRIADGAKNERWAGVTSGNALSVDIASMAATAVKVSDDANANTATNPMFVQLTNATAVNAKAAPIYANITPWTFDDDDADNCFNITAASQQWTLEGDYLQLCANGGTAYVLCGADPTATTTVSTGFTMIVGDGQCLSPRKFSAAKCAHIGAAAAGVLCYHEFAAP